MLKSHFGDILYKSEETKKCERKQKKMILHDIYAYNKLKGYGSETLTRFNPFMSSIFLKVSFLYLKTYSSNIKIILTINEFILMLILNN